MDYKLNKKLVAFIARSVWIAALFTEHFLGPRVSYPKVLIKLRWHLLLGVYTKICWLLDVHYVTARLFYSLFRRNSSGELCYYYYTHVSCTCCLRNFRVSNTREWTSKSEREDLLCVLVPHTSCELFPVMCSKLITNCYWHYHVLWRGIPRIVSL
jgi:hypothetical protein